MEQRGRDLPTEEPMIKLLFVGLWLTMSHFPIGQAQAFVISKQDSLPHLLYSHCEVSFRAPTTHGTSLAEITLHQPNLNGWFKRVVLSLPGPVPSPLADTQAREESLSPSHRSDKQGAVSSPSVACNYSHPYLSFIGKG